MKIVSGKSNGYWIVSFRIVDQIGNVNQFC